MGDETPLSLFAGEFFTLRKSAVGQLATLPARVNILFVNYGDYTTNSLNHIGGFANTLCALGHSCVVAVSHNKETLIHVRRPLFIAATYAELLSAPDLFPDHRPADIIHAWTPREGVRKFVLAYQKLIATPARVIIHLEDNEQFLVESYVGCPFAELRDSTASDVDAWVIDGLSHPLRHQAFLRIADAVTHIVERLREFAPAAAPTLLLPPGVDFSIYHPQAPDIALRRELGIAPHENLLVFTGSNTFANEPEMRDLYVAVALLNQRGLTTRLIRTGFSSPTFLAKLPEELKRHILDLGFVEKTTLPKLLALSDVLVQPGHPGPFNDYRLPSKLPEFFAMGKPVVLPNTNIAALLEPGRDAIVLATGTPDEIATICAQLFEEPRQREFLGKNAAEFARRHFDLPSISRGLAEFYTATLGRPSQVDWTQLRGADVTEVTLCSSRLLSLENGQAHHPQAAADAELLVALARHLDTALEHARAHPGHELAELRKRHEEIRDHAQTLQRTLDDTRRLDTQHIANVEKRAQESQQHIAALQRQLQETSQHAANLERQQQLAENHVANLTRDLETTRAEFHRNIGEFTRTTAELATTRERLTALEQIQRDTEQHASNLESLRRSLDQRIRELNTQCQHLESAISERDSVIAQREQKLRTIQSSFSWRITLPLRWLRRKLIDPRRRHSRPVTAHVAAAAVTQITRPPAENPSPAPTPLNGSQAHASLPVVMSVDNPQSWSLQPRKHVFRGWCFADDGRKLTGVRARIGARLVDGTYGFKRLDVFAAVRSKPNAEFCGWKIEAELTPADTALDLEVADESGAWHRFFHTAVRVGDGLGPLDLTSYEKWIEVYDSPSVEKRAAQMRESARFAHQPLVSIVMPVYNTPEQWLRRAVESVRAQSYPHWELCIADDASPAAHVRRILQELAGSEPRIKVVYRDANGHISAASNSALALAAGEFIGLLDHDDELAPHALFEVVSAINARPDADYFYSDEDKIDEDGRRFEPYFKPDWQPDLFLGQNYTSHFSVYRATLVKEVGGFRAGYEGSQDWDLALRIVEKTSADRIVHIPKVLYHWRAIAGSTALQLSEKNYPAEAARRALTDHFSRRRLGIELIPVPGDHWRAKWPLPKPAPLVSLAIPTRNGLQFLRRCVDSILRHTSYAPYEILIVDNGSDDPQTLAYLDSLQRGTHPLVRVEHNARVLRYDAPFNYSAINNYAVGHARGEIVGLLNNDLEVINADWLTEMVSHAVRPEIGCVGAMLYYPNDTIQHAGVVLGVGGVAGHAFREFPRGTEGKFNRARLIQNYSAVTAACLVIRKAIYTEVGGLDENDLAVAFNDVDFCLKVRAAGYRNLWTPFAELYHYESASRGADDTPEKAERFRSEVETMLRRWGPLLQRDPAYNPNLTLEHNDFSLASPPRPGSPA